MNKYGLPEELDIYIDIDSALKRLAGSKKMYAKTLNMLLKSREFDEFDKALTGGDIEKACTHAHSIKGMTGNLSITKLYEISSELNAQLNDGIKDAALIEKFKEVKVKSMEYVKMLADEFSNQ